MVRQAYELLQKYLINPSESEKEGASQVAPSSHVGSSLIDSSQSTSSRKSLGQLEFSMQRNPENDRNFHLGGRSFYFFDFDDNVAFLLTPLVLFHKETKEEVLLSTHEWAHQHHQIGVSGPYQDFHIDLCDRRGTFRNFRDQDFSVVEKVLGRKQAFVEDIIQAIQQPNFQWQGPSWSCFYHAAFNQRPISVITARGHHPETIAQGIGQLLDAKVLPKNPNYLSIFPVSHPQTRLDLGDKNLDWGVPQLKKAAIRASVEKALKEYGYSPHHRFGMSDDDPKNLHLIFEEMRELKKLYPEMSFFVIDTQRGQFVKHEVMLNSTKGSTLQDWLDGDQTQLPLF